MNKQITKVGAYTGFGGDLKHVIVGDMIDDSYFDNIEYEYINSLKQICKETKEDLDRLANIYTANDICVERPNILNKKPSIESIAGTNVINPAPPKTPHDHVLCIGNVFVNSFNNIERFNDQKSISHITNRLASDIKYVETQIPSRWATEYYDELSDVPWAGNKDSLHDGPSFYPCGSYVFYTKHYCNSLKGVQSVKKYFEHLNLKFIELQLPFKNHLDGQFRIIKPGHVISVHHRDVLIDQIPQFANWTIHHDNSWQSVAKQNVKKFTCVQDWIDTDTDHSSCDVGFVHINPNLVVITNENDILCKALEQAKVDWINADLRHPIFWNSSVSCATAILYRQDECYDYFN